MAPLEPLQLLLGLPHFFVQLGQRGPRLIQGGEPRTHLVHQQGQGVFCVRAGFGDHSGRVITPSSGGKRGAMRSRAFAGRPVVSETEGYGCWVLVFTGRSS